MLGHDKYLSRKARPFFSLFFLFFTFLCGFAALFKNLPQKKLKNGEKKTPVSPLCRGVLYSICYHVAD
jgi:hypothetical protein